MIAKSSLILSAFKARVALFLSVYTQVLSLISLYHTESNFSITKFSIFFSTYIFVFYSLCYYFRHCHRCATLLFPFPFWIPYSGPCSNSQPESRSGQYVLPFGHRGPDCPRVCGRLINLLRLLFRCKVLCFPTNQSGKL